MGHTDLGEHLASRGDLQGAFKAFVRSRDYCTAPAHIVAMCLAVVRVAAERNNFNHVANYVQKAEAVADAADALTTAKARARERRAARVPVLTPSLVSQLKAASGLALLESKKYKMAARRFCETPPELGSEFASVIAAQDIALYGGLTAIASFDRAELKTRVRAALHRAAERAGSERVARRVGR